jgi:hypothetical protein
MTKRDLSTKKLKCVIVKKNAKNSTILFLDDLNFILIFAFQRGRNPFENQKILQQ